MAAASKPPKPPIHRSTEAVPTIALLGITKTKRLRMTRPPPTLLLSPQQHSSLSRQLQRRSTLVPLLSGPNLRDLLVHRHTAIRRNNENGHAAIMSTRWDGDHSRGAPTGPLRAVLQPTYPHGALASNAFVATTFACISRAVGRRLARLRAGRGAQHGLTARGLSVSVAPERGGTVLVLLARRWVVNRLREHRVAWIAHRRVVRPLTFVVPRCDTQQPVPAPDSAVLPRSAALSVAGGRLLLGRGAADGVGRRGAHRLDGLARPAHRAGLAASAVKILAPRAILSGHQPRHAHDAHESQHRPHHPHWGRGCSPGRLSGGRTARYFWLRVTCPRHARTKEVTSVVFGTTGTVSSIWTWNVAFRANGANTTWAHGVMDWNHIQ
jgi:hypothetical protein